MNFEQWDEPAKGNETIESIVSTPREDRHSGEHLLDEYGDATTAMREEFGVDPKDKSAMLTKFRELSRNADTLGAAQLHNLYRKWEESEEGKNVLDEE